MIINQARKYITLGLMGALLSSVALPVSALTPIEVAKLLASDGAPLDIFGYSVSLDGDSAVIGSYGDGDNGAFSGSAYVFTRDGTGSWSQQAKLMPNDAAAHSFFGNFVALAGDTAVIGAPGSSAKAAYVFTRDGTGNWSQQAKLIAADGATGDGFGFPVALVGDTAFIGARSDDDKGPHSGSVYVFTRDGTGSWSQQAKLTATDGTPLDNFGFGIALAVDTAVIGAVGDSTDGSQSGSAYVFIRDGTGNWSQQAKLIAADAAAGDRFGVSVALSGDTAVIGAYNDDYSFALWDSGSAYVFTRDGTGNWSQQAKLIAADVGAIDNFGFSVALVGDTALIGAYLDDDKGNASGSAYLFTRDGTGNWSEQAKLTAADGATGDSFGFSVALVGDTALIGAHGGDDSGSSSGSAYIYSLGIGPKADAGPDQSENEGLLVTLDGSASTNATNYVWSQIAGPIVSLSSTTAANPDFTAPYVDTNTTLNFQLIVDDGQGNFSNPDTVNITIVDVNNPPVADAGDDATIKEGAVATLNGSNSFDPEGDTPLGFVWAQTSGPLVTLIPGNTVVGPTFTAPLGVGNVLTFELVVDDGKEFSAPDEVVITVVANSQPVADAGPDQTVDEGSLVNLDGTGSSDPDGGDTITFAWNEPVMLNDATSPTPSFTSPFASPGGGVLAFDLVVTDDDPINPKSSNPDQVVINVRNINDPPSCGLARAVCPSSKIKGNDSCMLWPPNHKLITVNIGGVMDADAEYSDVTLQITGVTQDEPVNGGGDGDTSPDAIIQAGSPADSVLIRAERTGLGGAQENGRVYVVSFTASDGFENCTGSVSIGVPHDRKDTPVDDGQTIDSTQP